MKIKKNERLIPQMIVALGLTSTIVLAGLGIALNNRKQDLINHHEQLMQQKGSCLVEFMQSEEFKDVYNTHCEIINEQLNDDRITPDMHEDKLAHLNSSEFIENVMNTSNNKQIIKQLQDLNADMAMTEKKANSYNAPITISLLASVIDAFASLFYVKKRRQAQEIDEPFNRDVKFYSDYNEPHKHKQHTIDKPKSSTKDEEELDLPVQVKIKL